MKKDLISVIVPIYKVEKYLSNCIDSILNQTYKQLEIILIDDESPDRCPEICEEYKKKDARIVVVHKKNEGLGLARNTGLEKATGKYVLFVDSDDFIEKSMIEKLYDSIKKNNSDTSYCNYVEYYSDDNCIKKTCCPSILSLNNDEIIKEFLIKMIGNKPEAKKDNEYSMSVWHALYSLEIIKKNKICFLSEREYISEDILFDILYLNNSKKISFIDDNLYFYRCNNAGSLTKKISNNEFEKIIKLCNEIEKRLMLLLSSKKNIDIDELTTYIDRYYLGRVRTYLRKDN